MYKKIYANPVNRVARLPGMRCFICAKLCKAMLLGEALVSARAPGHSYSSLMFVVVVKHIIHDKSISWSSSKVNIRRCNL